VTLAAGAYGHDRWKGGASGCTYTFATVENVTTLTISAGSLIQVVEGLNLQSGTYTLSFSGTAQGKINGGAYSASGVTGTATGGTNMTIEFNTGTLSLVQLEKGSTATAFDYRPYGTELALCQRYLPATFNRVGNDSIAVVQCISSTIGLATISWNVTPRVNPTGITTSAAAGFYVTNVTANAAFNASALAFELTSNLVGQIRVTYANNSASAGNIVALYSNTSGAQILWTGCEL
jgi:hypothetical protein